MAYDETTEALRRENDALRARVAAMEASNSWRVGRLVTAPLRALKSMRGRGTTDASSAPAMTRPSAPVVTVDMNMSDADRFAKLQGLSNDAWRTLILESIDGRHSLVPLPRFPSPEMQASFVGGSGVRTMTDAFTFYAFILDAAKRFDRPVTASSTVLDFGVGWGRYARLFLREVLPEQLTLSDPWDLALDTCRSTGVPGHLVQTGHMPPSDLPSEAFDIAFAYSVFSHLSPISHVAWAEEFARVVRPGGLVFVTTQGPWFLDFCRDYREHPEKRTSPWHEKIAASFVDDEASLAQLAGGEMLYAPNGGGPLPSEFYGDSIVPRAAFEKMWTGFDVVEFVEDKSRFEQVVCVLRRRAQ